MRYSYLTIRHHTTIHLPAFSQWENREWTVSNIISCTLHAHTTHTTQALPYNDHRPQTQTLVLHMWRLKMESLRPYSSSQPQMQDGIQVCLSFCFFIPCKVSSEIVSCTIMDIGFSTTNVQELRLCPIKIIQIFILNSWIIILTVHVYQIAICPHRTYYLTSYYAVNNIHESWTLLGHQEWWMLIIHGWWFGHN